MARVIAAAMGSRVIRSIVAALLLCGWLPAAPASAIECLRAAGDPKTGWYSWREIDGRKCWFKKTGAMPAKSQLHWAAKEQEQPPRSKPVAPAENQTEPPAEDRTAAAVEDRTAPAVVQAVTPSAAEDPEPKHTRLGAFRTIRVKPIALASSQLGNDQVDLISAQRLSAVAVFGAPRRRHPSPADPFTARFKGWGD